MNIEMEDNVQSSSVFTNQENTSCSGTNDLLQQAFQGVVDEEESQDNGFVAFIQNDVNDTTGTIHLTTAQAAALGLTFQLDPNFEVMHSKTTNNEISEHLNVKNATNFHFDQISNHTIEPEPKESLSPSLNEVKLNSTNDQHYHSIQSTKAQILKRLPVILPSTQYIIKPAKNKKLLQNLNLTDPSDDMTEVNPNSIILSEGTILNGLSPRIIKATPINPNNILSPQVLTTSYEIPNKIINQLPIEPSQIVLERKITKSNSKQSIILNNSHTKSPVQIFKSLQIPSQLVSSVSSSVKINPKPQVSYPTSLLRNMQSSTPISILKPQLSVNDLKCNQNPSKLHVSPTLTTQNKISKPLGSSENPIQLLQQGNTFHSMHRLTHTQLKRIAQVLQQRNQDTLSNEKIVYRVVYPEELDLSGDQKDLHNIVKPSSGKRGRPKKNSCVAPPKQSPILEEPAEDLKDDRKKIIARTRSGRLSRPPKHMVRDYKHLHHTDFSQPDLDDSDGGYSDYYTNSNKDEDMEPKELLSGLEIPKRKISDHFRCPTCNKIYLGRTRMSRHFEMHPEHGNAEQLPPLSVTDTELKQNNNVDPLKRKGKKRGPWAYVTPEAKSERRQMKLKEAISVCNDEEIMKIAAKPVATGQSLFDLLILKSDNEVKNLLDELKKFIINIQENIGTMLTIAEDGETQNCIDIREEHSLCNVLGLNPNIYKLHNHALKTIEDSLFRVSGNDNNGNEPCNKIPKLDDNNPIKETIEERISSEFSESSDLSVSDFLNNGKNESISNTCPEVLSALTLMRRNPIHNNVSKLLISNPEIQNQISVNPGFQKIDINPTKSNYDRTSFIKLEPPQEENLVDDQGFQKLMSKIIPNDDPKSCKISDDLNMSNTCDNNVFDGTDNLDMSKINQYHLDILNTSSVIDKNLLMDEKLVEQLHSNLVDQLVSERLKNIIPDNILEMPNNTNLDTELDFEALSVEFNRDNS